jgi:aprataxin
LSDITQMANFACDWYDWRAERLCGSSFNRKANLERHIRDVHEKRDTERANILAQALSGVAVDEECCEIEINHNVRFMRLKGLQKKSDVHGILVPVSGYADSIQALQDPDYLALVRKEAQRAKLIIGSEIRRLYGPLSLQNQPREAVLNGLVSIEREEDMPAGRDFEKEVKVGVLAKSPIAQLQIHVLSPDLCAKGIQHMTQYNAFTTPFFIDLNEFPLTQAEITNRGRHLTADTICWRCGKNFRNNIGALKQHLAEEFEDWKTV